MTSFDIGSKAHVAVAKAAMPIVERLPELPENYVYSFHSVPDDPTDPHAVVKSLTVVEDPLILHPHETQWGDVAKRGFTVASSGLSAFAGAVALGNFAAGAFQPGGAFSSLQGPPAPPVPAPPTASQIFKEVGPMGLTDYFSRIQVSAPQHFQDLGSWAKNAMPSMPALSNPLQGTWLSKAVSGFLPEIRVNGGIPGAAPVEAETPPGVWPKRDGWGNVWYDEADYLSDNHGGSMMPANGYLTAASAGSVLVPAGAAVARRIGPYIARGIGISVSKLYDMVRKLGAPAVGTALGIGAMDALKLHAEAHGRRRGGGVSASAMRTTTRTTRKLISFTKRLRALCGTSGVGRSRVSYRFGKKCR